MQKKNSNTDSCNSEIGSFIKENNKEPYKIRQVLFEVLSNNQINN